MKKYLLPLFFIFILSIQSVSADSANYAIVAIADSSNNDIVAYDGSDYWLINYSYGCYGMYGGQQILLYKDGLYLDSYGSKIITGDGDSCDINSANEITETIFVDQVMDSDYNAIITDEDGKQYLIEYGIGCLSFWRYEGDVIYLYRGGTLIDGLSDKIFLPYDSGSCNVLNANEIGDGLSFNSSTNLSESDSTIDQNTLSNMCPDMINGFLGEDGECYCNEGYNWDLKSGSCTPQLQIDEVQCGINSIPTENGYCGCIEGYTWEYPDDANNFDCVAIETEEVNTETTQASAFESTFPDVSVIHKNFTAIHYLKQKGVIDGYPDNTFQPDKIPNRGELVKILVGGKGIDPPAETYNNCFPDVLDEWFARFVCYAKEQGWVSGYPSGDFLPANDVNKVESIKMAVNSQGYETVETVTDYLYEDVDNTQWYAPFIKAAKDRGLLEEEGPLLGVSEPMTRGGISEVIYRAMIIIQEGLNNFSEYNPSSVSEPDTSTSTSEPDTATPTPEPVPNEGLVCSTDTYNCSDFSTQSEAQSVLDQCMTAVAKDIHRLDGDGNGIACESSWN